MQLSAVTPGAPLCDPGILRLRLKVNDDAGSIEVDHRADHRTQERRGRGSHGRSDLGVLLMGDLLLAGLESFARAGECFAAGHAVRAVVRREGSAEETAHHEPTAALTALLLAPAAGGSAARARDRVLERLRAHGVSAVEAVHELAVVGRPTAMTDRLHHFQE